MVVTNKYSEFKKLLCRFVQQANQNVQDKENRKPTLGNKGFENNNFNRQITYDIVFIDGIEYHLRCTQNRHRQDVVFSLFLV